MNNWRHRLALGLAFVLTGQAFAWATDGLPYAPLFWLLYYGGAATVDLMMYRVCRFFVSSHLQRDIEALCIASIVVNALGWAIILADSPPDIYNAFIAGLNYALALRLFLGDGNVLDSRFYRNRIYLVLRNLPRHKNYAAAEEK